MRIQCIPDEMEFHFLFYEHEKVVFLSILPNFHFSANKLQRLEWTQETQLGVTYQEELWGSLRSFGLNLEENNEKQAFETKKQTENYAVRN